MSGISKADIIGDIGPLILGGLFAFSLSGCVNMQFMVYWQIYSDDRWATKSLVLITWILDLCHSTLIAVALWQSIITPFDNLGLLNDIPWSVPLAVEFTAFLTFVEQSFFADRIYRVQNRRMLVAAPVFILAFTRLCTGTATVIEMLERKSYIAFVSPWPSIIFILATIGLSLSVLTDIIIMIALCYFLRSNRSQVPMSSTNRIIDSLTLWTVETGSATCIGAIASLICLTAMTSNRVFLGIHFVVGKLYANSLLATLNARSKIRLPRRGHSSGQMVPVSVFPGAFRNRDNGPPSPGAQRQYPMHLNAFGSQPVDWKHGRQPLEVSVERMVESKYDDLEEGITSPVVKSAFDDNPAWRHEDRSTPPRRFGPSFDHVLID